MKDVVLVDFEDSFTFNIVSELYKLNILCDVIHWKKFSKSEEYKNYKCIILGPGPSHPKDYKEIYQLAQNIFFDDKFYLMGICLGHQIIWESLGATIFQKEKPIHGQSLDVCFERPLYGVDKFSLQFYNSLFVGRNNLPKSIYSQMHTEFLDEQLIFSEGKNFLSCQFHPESVGTSCQSLFFTSLSSFLYNGI